nr:hypothetical protein [Tanacetum cinerariifolium]
MVVTIGMMVSFRAHKIGYASRELQVKDTYVYGGMTTFEPSYDMAKEIHGILWLLGRPNGRLIHNSIINGPYVRRMIPEPGDTNREVLVNETFQIQIDDELTEKELKQIEADDQAIQTILLSLPKDIYAAVDSYETA